MKTCIKTIGLNLIALILFSVLFQNCTQPEKVVADFEWTTSSEDARALFLEGLKLVDVNDNTSSRDYFNQAIELDPDFAMAYIFRSFSSGSNEEFVNDTKKGMSLAEKCTEGEKKLIAVSETYLTNENDKRLSLLKEMTTMFPESARAWLNLGFAFEGRDERLDARNAFQKSIELDPNWVGGYVGLGTSYLFNSPTDFEKAKTNLSKAVDLDPKIGFSQINLGDAHRAMDNLDEAKNCYSKAMELNPKDFVAYSKRGHVNTFLGNMEEARKDFAASDKINPYGLNQFSAYTYLYAGDPDASLAALEKQAQQYDSLDLDDSRKLGGKWGCVNSCILIALHHNKPDHFAKLKPLRTELDAASTASLDSEDAQRQRDSRNARHDALEAAMLGDFQTAVAKAEEVKTLQSVNMTPTSLYGYNFIMGYIHHRQANYDMAVTHFSKGNPNWVYNKYYLAKSYEAAGQMDKAMPLYKEIAVYNFNGVDYALIRNEVREKVSNSL
jgi:tetratricopeptide (TPR) repeat protein